MDSLDGAVSLARALLSLWRARHTGILHVQTELGSCRLAIVSGMLRALGGLPGSEDTLGDALMRDGELDPQAHGQALERTQSERGAPVGRWLVGSGLVTRGALETALRRQLRARALRVLACQRVDYRFVEGDAEIGASWIEEPTVTPDLVLEALRARTAGWSHERIDALVPAGELRLNALGRALTRGAALWPEETVTVVLLEHGSTLSRVMQASQGRPRALTMLAILALMCGLGNEPLRARNYSLLLRKRIQLRHDADPRALLDLADDADPAEGRRALRRLARSLHPDALGPHASDALRAVSAEVMSALIDVEQTLRARG
jgi:hypothetical protein